MDKMEIVRTQEEIDDLIEDAYYWKGTGRFRGMKFEEGLVEMLDWLTDKDVERPLPVPESD